MTLARLTFYIYAFGEGLFYTVDRGIESGLLNDILGGSAAIEAGILAGSTGGARAGLYGALIGGLLGSTIGSKIVATAAAGAGISLVLLGSFIQDPVGFSQELGQDAIGNQQFGQ